MRRGQVSFEVLVAVGFLMALFVVVSIDAYSRNQRASELKTWLEAREVLRVFVDSVESVVSAGDGVYRYVSLPETIEGGYNYSITAGSGVVELSWASVESVGEELSSWNIRIHCLNYTRSLNNRIYNNNGVVDVTCSLPELSVIEDRIVLKDDILYVPIVNNGPLGCGIFGVSINGSSVGAVSSLGAEEVLVLEVDVGAYAAGSPLNLSVDYTNEVVESIEVNNDFLVTV